MANTLASYDAILILSFGGPEKYEDVIPFLENVLRGRNVPRERMLQVAEHYYHFDGRSPINDQNRALIEALKPRVTLPIYWGNRNWHPLLADTLSRMQADGVKRAVAFVTSAFGSYSGCRQYMEDIEKARAAVGALNQGAVPEIVKIPPFSRHPKFLAAMTDRVRAALQEVPDGRLIFTAHSVPTSMAETSPYVTELEQACAAVSTAVGREDWSLVYQSRSGPPTQPWLEPDICDHLQALHDAAARAGQPPQPVIIIPIGFLSDHMEVLYDLDTEAQALCDKLGIRMVRAGTAGTHPAMIEMIAELVTQEHAPCAATCCPTPKRPSVTTLGGRPGA